MALVVRESRVGHVRGGHPGPGALVTAAARVARAAYDNREQIAATVKGAGVVIEKVRNYLKRPPRSNPIVVESVPRSLRQTHFNKRVSSSGSDSIFFPLQEECLGSVTSVGAAFTLAAYLLNPANATTFPLMSRVMGNYDKYRTKQWYFRFESSSANAVGSTNTALGTVCLNCSYDAADAVWASQIQMEDYGRVGARKAMKEAVPSKSQTFNIKVLNGAGPAGDGWMYLLPAIGSTITIPSNTGIADYYPGIFQIATVGQQATSVVGRLFVGWSGWVKDRKVDTTAASAVIAKMSVTPTNTSAFASSSVLSGSTFTPTFTNTTMVIPITGRFQVDYYAVAGTTFTQGGTITASTGCTAITNQPTSTGQNVTTSRQAGNATTSYYCGITVDVVAPGTISWAAPTVVGACYGSLTVIQVPSALTLASPFSRLDILEKRLAQLIAGPSLSLSSSSSVDADDCKTPDGDLATSVHIDRDTIRRLLCVGSKSSSSN